MLYARVFFELAMLATAALVASVLTLYGFISGARMRLQLAASIILCAACLFPTVKAAELYKTPQTFDGDFYDQVTTNPRVPSAEMNGSYYFRVELTVDDMADFRPVAIHGGVDSHDIEIYLKPVAGELAPYFYVNHNRGNGGFFYSVAYPFVDRKGQSLVGERVLIEVAYAAQDSPTAPNLVVKFNGKVQNPFPIIPNNGFNNVFGARAPLVTGDQWVIGRIVHNQFGIRKMIGSMQGLEIGLNKRTLSVLQAGSERAPVVNDVLQRIVSSSVDPQTLIPVSILLEAPVGVDTRKENWDEIARIQAQFEPQLYNLPGYDHVVQKPYYLTTQPVVLVDLTPAQINDLSRSFTVRQLTEVLETEPDIEKSHDLIYTPDEIYPPYDQQAVTNSGYTGEGVVVAVIDYYLDPNPAYDDQILATFEYLGNDPNADVASCKPPKSADPSHGSLVTSLITGLGGVAPESKIVFYNKGRCVGETEQPTGAFGTEAALDRILVELELDSEFAPDLINNSTSRKQTELTGEFYSFNEHCDGVFSESRYIAISDLLLAITQDHGVPIFNSTGNDSEKEGINFPACLSYVTGVGNSTDVGLETSTGEPLAKVDEVWSSSNSAAHQELVAPGILIKQNIAFPDMESESGTSFSTPITTGVAALLLQKARDCATNSLICFGSGGLINSIEVVGQESVLPAILIGTGKPIIDPLATDPNSGENLVLPRLNALNALESGFFIPSYTIEPSPIAWVVDGYAGQLGIEITYDLSIDPLVDSSLFDVNWSADGTAITSANHIYSSLYANARAVTFETTIENRFGVSHTSSRLYRLPYGTSPPEIDFETSIFSGSRNSQDQLVIEIAESPFTFLLEDNCNFELYANDILFSEFTTSVEAGPTCGAMRLELNLKEVANHPSRRNRAEADYTVQICRGGSERSECSAIHYL